MSLLLRAVRIGPVLLGLVLLACTSGPELPRQQSAHAALPPPANATPLPPQLKVPSREQLFVYGPRVVGDSNVLTWLAAQRDVDGHAALLQLPVTITLAASGGAVVSAALATLPAEPSQPVHLDDSSMGIALADRVRQACPGQTTCSAWLEGTWLAQGDAPTMRVLRIVHAVLPGEAQRSLYARVVVDINSDPGLVVSLERLGSPLTVPEKENLSQELVAAGKASIPLLIASLDDERPYTTYNTGVMNAPPHEVPSQRSVTISVGEHASDLLYKIVTPAPRSTPIGNFKVYSEQVLSISNWHTFWNKHQHESLAEIHAALLPLVEAYWAQHGTTQQID